MIDEPLEEQACLYVLGILSVEEVAVFEAEMQRNSELSEMVASLNNATLALARSAPAVDLPARLKLRLLDSMAAHAKVQAQAVPPPPSRSKIVPLLPWAAAACLAGMLYWQSNVTSNEKTALQQSLETREKDLLETRTALSTAQAKASETQQALTTQLSTVEANRAELLARVTQLEAQDFIAQAKIAVLGSLLKDRPQAVAVSVWNQEKQNGLLVVENLPVLAPGKDYQLWVLDPSIAAPVSAGVFKVDAAGKVRLTFKPTQAIVTAGKFAVTEETEGGVLSPTMDKMVVIGGT
jgi:anti-sigma-K factor RskA